ncbi:MAG: iron-sulfur cluster assembly accessory protein [Gammaproteobacteria bacterium]|nr:iron-sulfur cluster assembly accessory protein [Gammaproteobacteria bacterium]
MSVKNFDPQAVVAAPVSVTPSAIEHFRRQLQKDQTARAVRLSVKESGCTGFMYVVDLVPELNDSDIRQQLSEGVELLIDRGSLNIVSGTQIDLVSEGVNRQLRFQNPNAKDHCGCGESFSVN